MGFAIAAGLDKCEPFQNLEEGSCQQKVSNFVKRPTAEITHVST
jgi:hypothetical protein